MRGFSIRTRIAVGAGLLAGVAMLLFGGVSIWWYAREERQEYVLEDHPTRMELREERANVREVVEAYSVALPVTVLAVAVGAWLLSGAMVRPLDLLAGAAEGIDARNLHTRLPESEQVHEIARLARVLNHLLSRLERSFEQSSRFAADASHELRTPLAIMRGTIEVAIHEAPMGPRAEMLVGLLEETQRLSAITDKLLLLARADAGRLLAKPRKVDLGIVAGEVAEDFQIMAAERRITVHAEISSEVVVDGDETLLRQVFLNLFDNALKYNVDGGWVRATLELTGDRARFSIANSGPAILPDASARLFERFFRGEVSRQRETGGAGLGLSLCSEIVVAHGGRLWLQSTSETETGFQMELPVKKFSKEVADRVS